MRSSPRSVRHPPYYLLVWLLLCMALPYHAMGNLSDPPDSRPFRPKKYEMRGVWLTTNYGLDWPSKPATNQIEEDQQKRELRNLLDQLVETGFNTIFLQVRSRGTLIYPSELEGINPALVSPRSGYQLTYDPLQFAIEECHKRGLSLHAWLAVMPVGSEREKRGLPTTAYLHQHQNFCIRYNGQWYMDPSHPATVSHLQEIVAELLYRYQVSGIHLDYIRYPDQAELFPDRATYEAMHHEGESIGAWRRENITRLVSGVHSTIKKSDQPVLLSAAVIGSYRELLTGKRRGWTAYAEAYQDPVAWAEVGVIDFITPMLYYQNHHFTPYLQDWLKVLPNTPVVVGLGAYRMEQKEGNWSPMIIQNQITEIQQYGDQVGGIVLFRARHALEHKYQLQPLLKQSWYRTNPLPFRSQLPRSATSSLPIITDLSLQETEEGLRLRWLTTLTTGIAARGSTTYTIYLTYECDEPDEIQDLQLITTQREILIPWSLVPKETTTYIKLGTYSPLTLQESFDHPGLLYYRTENPK